MKKPIKLLFVVLGVGCVIALAFFGWSAKAKGDATVHLSNGVEVTPIEFKSDAMAHLLGIKFWKFNVVWPHGKGHFKAGFSLCHNGKIDKAIVGGYGIDTSYSSRSDEIIVGFVPVSGTILDSKQLK